MKTLNRISLCITLVLCFFNISHASVTVYEGFNYSGTSRLVDNGTGGFGWSGPWTVTGGDNRIRTQTNPSAFPSANTAFPFSRIGGRLGHDDKNDAAQRTFTTPIDLTSDGGIYFSFLMSYPDATLPSGLTFTSSNTDPVGVQFTGAGNQISATAGAGTSAVSGTFSTETEYFVVGKITSSISGNDSLSVNVFQDGDSIPATESFLVSSTGAQLGGNLTGIAFTQGEPHDNDGDRAYLDEFRIGSSWEAVAIPEASTLLLCLVAFGAAVGIRKLC